jgi:predicted ATPase
MSHPFGDLLRQYCARKQGLSQTRLAHMVGYDQAVIARMAQGRKDLTGPSGRERVLAIIGVLREESVLHTQAEANALLKAASMPPLYADQPAEQRLLEALSDTCDRPAVAAVGFLPTAIPISAPIHFTPPAPLTPLIGREREMVDIMHRLTTARLVTLTGAGGSGKTRLALEVASRCADQFPHGACFVELAPLQQAVDVVSAIAQAMQVPPRPDVSRHNALKLFLANKTLLLVLDNFEHVLDAASVVTDLLVTAPHVQVLTTSREPLRVHGEHVIFIESLRITAAVELFTQRALAVNPGFALQGNEEVVADICRRVDCLPLAIELAAANARHMSPRSLLEQLSVPVPRQAAEHRGLDVLVAGLRDAPERHRTLRNAIAWSYELLSDDEQRLLRALSVFAGGAEIEQIRGMGDVAVASSLSATLPRLLTALTDKNLVRADEQRDGSMRYHLLEMIREFSLDDLAQKGELDRGRCAHAIAFCVLVEEAEAYIHHREQKYWVARLGREHDNIRAALTWSLSQTGDLHLGMRLASRMWLFWWMRDVIEGAMWLRKVIDKADSHAPPLILGRAYLGYGVLITALRITKQDEEQARAALEEAIRLLQQVNDSEGVAFALYMIGVYCPEDDRLQALIQEDRSIERWQDSHIGIECAIYSFLDNLLLSETYHNYYQMMDSVIAVASKKGDMQLLATVLVYRCLSMMFADDLPHARDLAAQALSAARSLGVTTWLEAWSLTWLGEVQQLLGELDSAQRCLEESLRMIENYGWLDKMRIAPLSIMGKVTRDRGDYATARFYFLQALNAAAHDYQWWGLEGMACIAAAQGQCARGARLLGAAEADRQRRNDLYWEKDKRDLAPYIAMLRAGLGDTAYEAAFAEGCNMNLAEAKAYAHDL